jgi:hypothetical protein
VVVELHGRNQPLPFEVFRIAADYSTSELFINLTKRSFERSRIFRSRILWDIRHGLGP